MISNVEGSHSFGERQRPCTPDRERAFESGLRVILTVVIRTQSGSRVVMRRLVLLLGVLALSHIIVGGQLNILG